MLRRYAAGASALLLVLSGVGAVIAAGRPDGPEPIDFSTQGAGALADWQDLTGLSALLPCPDSPATLGAGTTSADLNALLLAWETAGATTPCSAVLTFTAPTATTYTLDKAYGMKGGLVLDGSPSGGVTLLAATNKNHFKFTAGASLAVQGLTFKGGYPNSGVYTTSGGAIDFAYGGSLRVVSCIFEGNQAESGGAIQTSLSGPATIVASMFRNNDGDRSDNGYNGGAIYAYSTNLTISDSTFIGNTAGYVSEVWRCMRKSSNIVGQSYGLTHETLMWTVGRSLVSVGYGYLHNHSVALRGQRGLRQFWWCRYVHLCLHLNDHALIRHTHSSTEDRHCLGS